MEGRKFWAKNGLWASALGKEIECPWGWVHGVVWQAELEFSPAIRWEVGVAEVQSENRHQGQHAGFCCGVA